MHISITHEATYPCEPTARAPLLLLRLMPSRFDAQHVLRWRIECGDVGRIRAAEDAFGNHIHIFSGDGPLERVQISVSGEVETFDQAGVVRNASERLPAAVFLRQTPATEPDADIRAFAQDIVATGAGDQLSALHALMRALHQRLPVAAAEPQATAQAAFVEKVAAPRDHAHIFVGAARSLNWPARFISGYRLDDADGQVAHTMHEWAEVMVADYGWIGFDSAYDICPTDRYVRVAAAADYYGAAPVVGARFGGDQTVNVTVRAAAAMSQTQS